MVAVRRRRRRRPIVPLLALVLTVVVATVVLGRRSSNGPDARRAWLDEIRPAVVRSNEIGTEVDGLRDQLASTTRPLLGRRLRRLAMEAEGVAADVAQADAPRPMRTTASLLVACMTLRAGAVADLAPAIDAALGDGPEPTAVQRLVAVGRDLAVADRTYEVFLQTAPRFRPGAVPSRWIGDGRLWQSRELTTVVTRLRSSATNAPVHDLTVVTMITDPPATGVEGAADVLPAVRALRLHVVVANVGNETERRVPVVASLTTPTGIDTARQFVDLEPGQHLAVQLGGLRPVPNVALTLSVKVGPAPGETKVVDNETTRQLLLR